MSDGIQTASGGAAYARRKVKGGSKNRNPDNFSKGGHTNKAGVFVSNAKREAFMKNPAMVRNMKKAQEVNKGEKKFVRMTKARAKDAKKEFTATGKKK